MNVRRTAAWLVPAALAGVALAGSPEKWGSAADQVAGDAIRSHTVVLGGDALEGRAPGSRGGRAAASYIAAELKKYVIEPLGDNGSYLQMVPLVGSTPLPESRLTISGLGSRTRLELGEDYLLHTTGAQTWLPRPTPMVFVGYGIVAPEFDYNDYADVDVRGKVVVFLAGEPYSVDPEFFAGREPTVYSSVESKVRIALSRGAVASVLVPVANPAGGTSWSRLQNEYHFEHLSLASSVPSHLAVLLRPEIAATLFDDALFEFDQVLSMERRQALRSFHLPVSMSFEGSFRVRSFLAANVVGRMQGSDSRLARESIVVTAHYDHLGLGLEVRGDGIYNGVIDNAIGCAGLLELARVVATSPLRPKRSIIFVFTTAEEEGNLGARYFLDHPPVPLSSMAANINIDGIAFHEMFESVVGVGAELSDLGPMLKRAAAARGLDIGRLDELALGREAFERSEQAVFADCGIPAILVNEGLEWRSTPRDEAVSETLEWFAERYHSPFDDLTQPLDFEAAREHVAVILTVVGVVADAPVAPEWRPGVPYAYQRLLMLAEEKGRRPRP